MYGRSGLDRFKKSQTVEPFSVSHNSSTLKPVAAAPQLQQVHYAQNFAVQTKPQQLDSAKVGTADLAVSTSHITSVGGGQSNWQPPDWAVEPRPGVYYLEVLKDGEVLDRISLDKKRHIFGRQHHTCDFVLDHPSVSRQHAAVVPHRNGR